MRLCLREPELSIHVRKALEHEAWPAHPVTLPAYRVAAADTVTGEGTRAFALATRRTVW